jgi:hypothetical protein
MDQQGIARRALERRLAIEGPATAREQVQQTLRARYARGESDLVDTSAESTQTAIS